MPTFRNGSPLPRVVSGTLAAVAAATEHFRPDPGAFSVTVSGTFVGSVQVERSVDGGTVWVPVSATVGGAAVTWTAPGFAMLSEAEPGARWRARCTAFTSGTVSWRFGQ